MAMAGDFLLLGVTLNTRELSMPHGCVVRIPAEHMSGHSSGEGSSKRGMAGFSSSGQ